MRRDVKSPQRQMRLMGFRLDGTATGKPEITEIECVADVATSLNDTYITFSSTAVDYYAWFNVDAGGTDPEVADMTGVEVAISEDDSADAVAAALAAAIDALPLIAAVAATDTVTVTNGADGAVEDADNGAASPGFTITVTQQGVASSIDLVEGQYDATLTEGTNNGEYILTFANPFGRVPSIIATPVTADVIVKIHAAAIGSCEIRCFDATDGVTAKDADLHIIIAGAGVDTTET